MNLMEVVDKSTIYHVADKTTRYEVADIGYDLFTQIGVVSGIIDDDGVFIADDDGGLVQDDDAE